MANFEAALQAVKDAHNALTQAVNELDALVPDTQDILKGGIANAVSVVRSVPRLMEHALGEQKRNDALLAQQKAAGIGDTPPVAPPVIAPITAPAAIAKPASDAPEGKG